jgi:hypothetical protein
VKISVGFRTAIWFYSCQKKMTQFAKLRNSQLAEFWNSRIGTGIFGSNRVIVIVEFEFHGILENS